MINDLSVLCVVACARNPGRLIGSLLIHQVSASVLSKKLTKLSLMELKNFVPFHHLLTEQFSILSSLKP